MGTVTSGATGQEAEAARLAAILAAASMRPDQVAGYRALTGGTYNAVYLVRRAGGAGLVVKVAPDPGGPMLRYERGILATEAMYYRLAGQLDGIAVPEVVAVDAEAGTYLLMSQCPGDPWHELRPQPAGRERDDLRAEVGRQVAVLHTITGTGFGYPSWRVAPLRPRWRAAFGDMMDAVLADAVRFAAALPRPPLEIREMFAARSAVLDEVTTPVLVHFDLWDGNVLVDSDGERALRVGGLIDAERAFWGDPLAEMVSLALFGDIERDAAFLRGYRSAGGAVTFDAAARRRLSLYRAYLYLIMLVEAEPRKSDDERRGWLARTVFRPLAAMLDDWSRAR
jgi:aminoglycoside phosphotransferase (APT) family kinase protein